jgi:hypothetical protein
MSKFRIARLSLLLATLGLTAAPALLVNAHAQDKPNAEAAKPEQVREEIFKLLDPAVINPMMTAKNFAAVEQRLVQAEAIADKTGFETFVLHRQRAALGSASGNQAMMAAGLEGLLATKRLTPKEQDEFTFSLARTYFSLNNFAKVIEWSGRYQKESATPARVRDILVRSYYNTKDFANTLLVLKPMLAEGKAAGKAPTVEELIMLMGAGQSIKDQAAVQEGLELMVTYHPTPEYWSYLLGNLSERASFNPRMSLDVYRLRRLTQKEMRADSYVELGELALEAGLATEAKLAVDAGYEGGILGKGNKEASHKNLRDRANKGAADDARNMGAAEAATSSKKEGLGMVNIGFSYVTMGQFDKGITLMQQGIAKGGLKRPEEASLHLGVALAKAGRKDEAVAVFQAIKGTDTIADLARYWVMHLNAPVAAK